MEGYAPKQDIFSTRYEPKINSFLSLKSRPLILILGAYFPQEVQDRLDGLKLFLQNNGYKNTFLVKDLRDPPRMPQEEEDKYIARKSHFWMNRANVLLFVFFCKGKNEGVSVELGLATEMVRIGLIKRAAFYEKKCIKTLSRMITGVPKLALMDQYYFNKDDDLYVKARAVCFEALKEIIRTGYGFSTY
ncbi:MAG: hypothetical protein QXU11_12305 [Thermoproteota archaeon]